MAGRAPRRRQGHHASPLRRLAGDARGGRLPLPARVWAHGFVSHRRRAIQQVGRREVALDEAIDRYGPDAFRYFLLREVPFDGDGNFSWERFDERYISDLANALGNLANRTLVDAA